MVRVSGGVRSQPAYLDFTFLQHRPRDLLVLQSSFLRDTFLDFLNEINTLIILTASHSISSIVYITVINFISKLLPDFKQSQRDHEKDHAWCFSLCNSTPGISVHGKPCIVIC